jgi:hypothetical protein
VHRADARDAAIALDLCSGQAPVGQNGAGYGLGGLGSLGLGGRANGGGHR